MLFLSLSLNLYFYLTPPLSEKNEQLELTEPVFSVKLSQPEPNNPFNPKNKTQTPDRNIIEQANQYFKTQQFDLAIEAYSDIIVKDDVLAKKLLNSWLRDLYNQLSNNNNESVAAFTSAFFNYNLYQINVMQLEAERLSNLTQYRKAIKLYKDIVDNSFDIDTEQLTENKIHILVQKQYALLSQQGLWKETLLFLEKLLFDEPDHPPYLLLLSKTKIELNQLISAREILLQLAALEESPAQVDTLLQQVETLLLGESAIPLIKHGEHYIISGQFDSQSTINLMIDTGASLSVLSQDAFDNLPSWLNPSFSRQIDINTAGGVVNTSVYRFDQFQINGYQVKSIEFAVMDLEQMDNADGLLGMNFLKHFAFQIDQKNNQLILNSN
jgi:clan AA aspartic protease (TIGR02281 family)